MKHLPVWLFVPNLIGYVRIIAALWGFAAARDPSRWAEFFWCYAVSYSLDAVDGTAARRLKQTSRLGAVLDMVTDRFCTAGLLSVLGALYPSHHWVFTYLMILDIVSHWAQMYRRVTHRCGVVALLGAASMRFCSAVMFVVVLRLQQLSLIGLKHHGDSSYLDKRMPTECFVYCL